MRKYLKRRILSLWLAVCMVLTMMPSMALPVWADSVTVSTTSGDITATDGTVTVQINATQSFKEEVKGTDFTLDKKETNLTGIKETVSGGGGTTVTLTLEGDATKAGDFAITVKDDAFEGHNVNSGSPISFSIKAAEPKKLSIKTEPTAPNSSGGALAAQPAIDIQDIYGNLCDEAVNKVKAEVGAGTGWELGGTATQTASSGTATFSGLTATNEGNTGITDAKIKFTSEGLTEVLSGVFSIPAPAPEKIDGKNITIEKTGKVKCAATEGGTMKGVVASSDPGASIIDTKIANGWTKDTLMSQVETDLSSAISTNEFEDLSKMTLTSDLNSKSWIVVVEVVDGKVAAIGSKQITDVSPVVPVISTDSKLLVGAEDSKIVITTTNGKFGGELTGEKFNVEEGGTGLSINSVAVSEDAKTATLTMSGTTKAGVLNIKAKQNAFVNASADSNEVSITTDNPSGLKTLTASIASDGTVTAEATEESGTTLKYGITTDKTDPSSTVNGWGMLTKESDAQTVISGSFANYTSATKMKNTDSGKYLVIIEVSNLNSTLVAAKVLPIPEIKTPAPVFSQYTYTMKTAEETNATFTFADGSGDRSYTYKVYADATTDETVDVAIISSATSDGEKLTLTFGEGKVPTTETTYYVSATETGNKESDCTRIIVRPYVKSDRAEITAVKGTFDDKELSGEKGAGTGNSIADAIPYIITVPSDAEITSASVELTVDDAKASVFSNNTGSVASDAAISNSETTPGDNGGIKIDTVDFTNPLYVKVVSEDGTNTRIYKITTEQTAYKVETVDTPTDGVSGGVAEQAAVEAAVKATVVNTDSNKVIEQAVLDAVESNSSLEGEKNGKLNADAAKVYLNSKIDNDENDGDTVKILAVPYLDITVANDGYTADKNSYTLDVTPRYYVIAAKKTVSEAENAKVLGMNESDASKADAVKLNIGEDPELRGLTNVNVDITLPASFTEQDGPVYVKIGDDAYATKYKAESGKITVKFAHFSKVVITADAPGKACVGDVYYDNLQDAIDAVTNGGTVTLTNKAKASDLTGLKAPAPADWQTGFSFTLDGTAADLEEAVKNVTFGEVIGKDGWTYKAKADSTDPKKYIVTREVGPGGPVDPDIGGGSGSTPSGPDTPPATTDSVTVPSTSKGSVSVSNRNAKAGDTVTVTPKANDGYVVDQVVVTDKNGRNVQVTPNSDGTYSFVMPEEASQPVKVDVTFKKDEGGEVTPPTTEGNLVFSSENQADAIKNRITTDADTALKLKAADEGVDIGDLTKWDVTSDNEAVVEVLRPSNMLHYVGVGTANITVKATGSNGKVYSIVIPISVKLGTPTFTLSHVSSKKARTFTVTTSTVRGADGFQVKYSLKKSLKSSKTRTYECGKKLKRQTVKANKSKRTYYVRVRAYIIDEDGNITTGAWSKLTKKIKSK